jgi:GMP synthase (glutamine-hydrolysing)
MALPGPIMAAGGTRRDLVYYIDVEPVTADPDIGKKCARIAAASGCTVKTVSYRDLINNPASRASMRAPDVLAWFISGSFSEWSDYPASDLTALQAFLVNEVKGMPVLGVCAGHQLMAMAYGSKVGHMGCFDAKLSPPDSACPEAYASSPSGWKTLVVTRLVSHALFTGISPAEKFNFSHHDEVKSVPGGFVNLAQTPSCAIQVMAHSSRVIYTTQFHPEYEVAGTADGGASLMRNFFSLARGHWGV